MNISESFRVRIRGPSLHIILPLPFGVSMKSDGGSSRRCLDQSPSVEFLDFAWKLARGLQEVPGDLQLRGVSKGSPPGTRRDRCVQEPARNGSRERLGAPRWEVAPSAVVHQKQNRAPIHRHNDERWEGFDSLHREQF